MADQTPQSVECPKCGHSFSATQAFEEHIAFEAQKLAAVTTSQVEKQYEEKLEKARRADTEQLDEKAAEKAEELMSSFNSDLIEEKKKIFSNIKLRKN